LAVEEMHLQELRHRMVVCIVKPQIAAGCAELSRKLMEDGV